MIETAATENVQPSARSRAPLNAQLTPLSNDAALANTPQAQPSRHSKDENRPGTIFNVPDGQSLKFAVEASGGINGFTDDDAYLFITEDEKNFHTFVVPKTNPGKQREVRVANGRFDTERHEFHLTFGQGNKLFLQAAGSAVEGTLNGRDVRIISDRHQKHSLAREKEFYSLSSGFNGTGVETEEDVIGDSWMFLQKDLTTGRILRFTQTGTSGVGRLEVIQGDPVDKDRWNRLSAEIKEYAEKHGYARWDKNDAYREQSKMNWIANGEKERPPISVQDGVALPDVMKRQVVGTEGGLKFYSPSRTSEISSIGNLVNQADRDKVARETDTTGMAAELNAREQRQKASTPRVSPPRM